MLEQLLCLQRASCQFQLLGQGVPWDADKRFIVNGQGFRWQPDPDADKLGSSSDEREEDAKPVQPSPLQPARAVGAHTPFTGIMADRTDQKELP